uniref:tRNA(Ile)-lysidine synthase n=1 Tax=Madagascaria erythrocladioides TaxID=753684 RepID=UPI001FCD47B8|nr:tRNA(Ile)-lysidine synthase [Madagascaria erythrocladioides]UNJ16500.1 tRNA(Ile)-lysidine synthase [Madagascaria erythrocladioides]
MFFLTKTSPKIYTEEEARQWRYSSLIELARRLNLSYVLTAHTQTDKIETALLNIAQGAGLEGITSMQFYNKINTELVLLHPILNLSREETLWFCRKFCLPIWSDTTNYNYSLKRNRIRHELIPYFQHYFNVNFEKSISQFLYIVNDDLEYLQKRCNYIYLKYKHPKFISLNKLIFNCLPENLKKRLIRIFVYHHTKIKLSFLKTQDLLLCINNCNTSILIHKQFYLYTNLHWIYILEKSQILNY